MDAGLFHHFHQMWTMVLCDALNHGVLPKDYCALVEYEPRVVEAHPRKTDAQTYAARANRIGVRTRPDRLVGLIDVVSPGDKDTATAVRAVAERTQTYLARGVHLLVVDLFAANRSVSLVSHVAGSDGFASMLTGAVGDSLPRMGLSLSAISSVDVPLEGAYMETWDETPEPFKKLVLHPELYADD